MLQRKETKDLVKLKDFMSLPFGILNNSELFNIFTEEPDCSIEYGDPNFFTNNNNLLFNIIFKHIFELFWFY